jgi:hypothetical protein
MNHELLTDLLAGGVDPVTALVVAEDEPAPECPPVERDHRMITTMVFGIVFLIWLMA